MPVVSIRSEKGVRYPAEGPFSPSTRFPEYPFPDCASVANPVYASVRDCLRDAGLDAKNYGRASWNPLGHFVQKGQRVFVLCNFVTHRRAQESLEAFAAKCTHGSVLRAVVDYVLLAVGPEGSVTFGNAPLQSCRWDSVLSETGADSVVEFYGQQQQNVSARDLRGYVVDLRDLGNVRSAAFRSPGDMVEVDLGRNSRLEMEPRVAFEQFRVSDYDPRAMQMFHGAGRHVYALHRSVLEADVIVSVPKLKTHEKVGITCALKGCVGAITRKECLAHHRYGPPSAGGDEYPADPLYVKRLVSAFHDWTQQTKADSPMGVVARVADRLARTALRRSSPTTAGAWWGNDTAWRMTLDIAAILRYAGLDGHLRDRPIRPHLTFVDGIVGGEGQGPLNPEPVPTGTVLFADDPVVADDACARIMGLDPERIPLIREACAPAPFGLTDAPVDEAIWFVNGSRKTPKQGTEAALHRYRPAPGWAGHIEQRPLLST